METRFRLLGGPARRRGAVIVELAILAVVLLLLVYGMIDFGRALLTRHAITSLSREAANLASRGTTFADTRDATLQSSGSLDIQQNGYVILTAVTRDVNGNLQIIEQLAGGGQPSASRIGAMGSGSVTLPPNVPLRGQILYVAEVFLNFAPVTPVNRMIGVAMPTSLYDVAYF